MAGLGERGFWELRVHGVAGTPPADTLGMRPKLVPPEPTMLGKPPTDADEDVTVWRRPQEEPDLLAFSWGSLTSGRPITAFYVLLLPYMLANFAGWMMLPLQKEPLTLAAARANPHIGRSWPLRVVTLLVRLAGLLVTVIFALSTYLIVANLGAYQWLVRVHRWPAWLVGVGVLLTGGVILLLFYFTRVRLRPNARYQDPWQDEADPVGYACLHRGQAEMWNRPGIMVRLHRLHLAAAWASVALVAGYARPWMPGGEWQAWDRVAVGLAMTALALAVVLLGAVTLGRGVKIPQWVSHTIRSVSWLLAAVALLFSAVRVAGIGAPAEWPPSLPALRGTAYWVALAYLILVLTAGLFGWFERSDRDVPRRARWNLPGLLVLAAAIGSGLGAGFAFQARRLLGGCDQLEVSNGGGCDIVVGPYGDWLAIALTINLVVLGSALLVRVFLAYRRYRPANQRVMVAVRAALDHASWLLFLVALLGGLAIASLAVAAANGGLPEATSLPRWVALVVTVPLFASAAVAAFWLTGRVTTLGLRVAAIVVLIVLIVLTVAAVHNGWQYLLLGLPVPPTTFLELAQLVGLLPLVLLVARSIYAGLQDRSARRGVGILWDIGTFWPRWFHPFAPPTYSDRAVTYLTAELGRRLMDPDHRVLLAPHSQGSIIGAAAILGLAEDAGWHRVALLTYGSPWSRFYAEFCPAIFSSACLESLCDRLRDGATGKAIPIRWRNLYRTSDPIGGPIPIQDVDVEPLDDEHGRVHSSYEREAAYHKAVRELRHLLDKEQAPSEQHRKDQHKAGGAGESGQKRGALDRAGQQATRQDGERYGGQRQERSE